MKKEINALKAENSKLQETQYQQSRKIASTAPKTSTTSRLQSSIQKK